ncbi:MAG TPA: amino acid permease [Accumulibacter sp.]|uniref:APC family permease n=1 Tax=Accumulibacter sp. TaxID=2053492 RepID=UPI0025F1AFA8|nr:amino acid permease [Accumulibacter sp.]MCM8598811.1 amino acid permease [Accumulibacter sp.]MCM8662707.1 amino acid permease [Accumulibacter sp.]HNF92574.1 amino acid permease [Accumulibacter sp.]
MGLTHAVFIVIASMLGTGILTTTGLMAARLGGPYEILAVWVMGAVLAISGVICYGAIIRRNPVSGGEATIIGAFYYPSWGYLTAILSFLVGFAASNAAASMALAAYFMTGTGTTESTVAGFGVGKLLAIGAIVLMTLVHAQIKAHNMRIQTLLAILKFLLLLGVATCGLMHIDWQAGPLTTANWQGATLDGWTLCLLFSVFTYSGWNAAIYSASEFRQPERTVPLAMLAGTGIVIVLYLSLNVAILGNLPSGEISGVQAIVARLVEVLFGAEASRVFALLIAVVLLSSIGVSSFAGPRVLHSILVARRREGATASPVPSGLLWIQASASILLVVTGSFVQVMGLMGVFLGIAPVLMVLGIYRRRRTEAEYHPLIRYFVAPVFIGFSSVVILISLVGNQEAVAFVFGLFVTSASLIVLESRGLVRVR